jgi:hypothetical protein
VTDWCLIVDGGLCTLYCIEVVVVRWRVHVGILHAYCYSILYSVHRVPLDYHKVSIEICDPQIISLK